MELQSQLLKLAHVPPPQTTKWLKLAPPKARLRALPDQRARQAKIIYIQMVSNFEPTGWRRSQCEVQIRQVARSLRVRLVPNQLTVRVPYSEELGKAAMRVAMRRVVEGLGLSSCLKMKLQPLLETLHGVP